MRRFGLPVLPLIIGVILGPRVEEQLTQALAISQGDVSTLWGEPVAIVVYVVMALLLLGLVVGRPAQDADKPARRTHRPPTARTTQEVDAMTIVVGYSPDAYGRAAARARRRARPTRRGERLVVVNATTGAQPASTSASPTTTRSPRSPSGWRRDGLDVDGAPRGGARRRRRRARRRRARSRPG